MKKVIKELGEHFDISGKELLILDALSNNKKTALEISKDTKIPIGRIYEYLNKLISLRLIERSEKKPYSYYIANLDNNIIDFLRFNFEETVRKQNRIMYLIEHRSRNFDEIDIINSGDDFSFRTVQLVNECKYLKNVTRHASVPFILYPENSKDFLKVRNLIVQNRETLAHTTPEMTFMLYKTHNDAYKKGKSMEYILEESTLKYHTSLIKRRLGKKFYSKMKKEIKERLSRFKNVKVYVINELTPMHVLITERRVFLSLIHQRHTQGLIITNKSAVDLYNNYFQEMKERCREIRSIL